VVLSPAFDHIAWTPLDKEPEPASRQEDGARQRALITIIEDETLPHPVRMHGMRMLGRSAPTEATIRYLRAKMDDELMGTAAAYSLGAAIGSLRSEAPLRADSLMREMTNRLALATDIMDTLMLLRALRNTADPELFLTLRVWVGHPDARVRSEALRAMKEIEGEDVDELFAEVLRFEESPLVRRATIFASLKRRTVPRIAKAVTDAAKTDSDERIRLAAVHVLGRWLQEDPRLREVLVDIAATERNERVRSTALASLNQTSKVIP